PTDEACQRVNPFAKPMSGAQDAYNYAAQSILAHLENTVTSPIAMTQESLIKGQEDAYTNPQKPSLIMYQGYNKDGTPNPPPAPIQSSPLPESAIALFTN